MNDFTARKSNGKDIRQANLRPVRPGEVRNPSGTNQYSYRRDFERTIDRLLAGVATEAEIEAAQIPEHVREGVTAETTRGKVIARVLVAGAMAGDSKHLAEVVKRLWPVTSKHEVSGFPEAPHAASLEANISLDRLSEEERKTLKRLMRKAIVRPIDTDHEDEECEEDDG